MANWNLPTITSNYLDFVSEVNNRLNDVAGMMGTGFGGAITNYPVGTVRFLKGVNTFDEWNGTTFDTRAIAVTGGGTGAINAASARVNLGIGSMGTQNSNAVNITGGSITGVNYSAADITSGVLALARGGTGSSLAITPSGTVMISNGSIVGLSSGVNIGELNASALSIGTVPLSRLSGVATGVGLNQFSGANLYIANVANDGSPMSFIADRPGINWYCNIAPANQHRIRFYQYENGLLFQHLDDAYTTAVNIIDFRQDGTVVCYGGGINNLNANNITDGTVNPARLGAGIANSTTFLRGDGQWAPASGQGSGIPSGLIALFDTACPVGWTRVASLDNRFPLGGTGWGGTGGSSSHYHNVGLNTSSVGDHSHSFSESGNGSGRAAGTASGNTNQGTNSTMNVDAGNSGFMSRQEHSHSVSLNIDIPVNVTTSISGNTSAAGGHSHQVSGNTSNESNMPPYLTVVYCRKN